MRALIAPDHSFAMGWSARAGSASAVTAFFEHVGFAYGVKALEARERYERLYPLPADLSNVFTFKVVRCPYSRAVSAWQWATLRWYYGIGFREFLERLPRLVKNGHWLPQYEFGESYDLIVKLESPPADLPFSLDKRPLKHHLNTQTDSFYHELGLRRLVYQRYQVDFQKYGYSR